MMRMRGEIYKKPASWTAIVHLAGAGEDDENLRSHYVDIRSVIVRYYCDILLSRSNLATYPPVFI